jgi:molybdopterin-containing oxidoreductase family iron-sulfur binding subunit
MEKCTFCVQRIQEKKLQAKSEGRPLKDGEIITACQQVCPTQAITFGDLNNQESQLHQNVENPRTYHLLEEIHTLPSVSYMTNIRNK